MGDPKPQEETRHHLRCVRLTHLPVRLFSVAGQEPTLRLNGSTSPHPLVTATHRTSACMDPSTTEAATCFLLRTCASYNFCLLLAHVLVSSEGAC